MVDGGTRNNNQRVTNARIQMTIENMDKKLDALPEIQDKLHDIDSCVKVVARDVDRNKEDIDDLQRRSNINDIIIGTGTIVAGIVGSLFGGRQ
jgi:hypothetical protein